MGLARVAENHLTLDDGRRPPKPDRMTVTPYLERPQYPEHQPAHGPHPADYPTPPPERVTVCHEACHAAVTHR
jgi:hypothetical protein